MERRAGGGRAVYGTGRATGWMEKGAVTVSMDMIGIPSMVDAFVYPLPNPAHGPWSQRVRVWPFPEAGCYD